jgi:RHS repeat-associated protein
MTTFSGSTGQDYEYDVFGKLRGTPGSERFLFAGQWFDANARQYDGLYYLRNRVYDPSIGRFLTRDPLSGSPSNPQTQNRYAYVENNPVNRVDPTGLDSEGVTSGVIPHFVAIELIAAHCDGYSPWCSST